MTLTIPITDDGLPENTEDFFVDLTNPSVAGITITDDQATVSILDNDREICDDGIDNDGDGLVDCFDPDCYLAANSGALDSDGDGIGDTCDLDNDNDGIANENECSVDVLLQLAGNPTTHNGVPITNDIDLSDGDILEITNAGVLSDGTSLLVRLVIEQVVVGPGFDFTTGQTGASYQPSSAAISIAQFDPTADSHVKFYIEVLDAGTGLPLAVYGKGLFKDIDSQGGRNFTEVLGTGTGLRVSLGANLSSLNYINGNSPGTDQVYYGQNPNIVGDPTNWTDEPNDAPTNDANWVTVSYDYTSRIHLSYGVTGTQLGYSSMANRSLHLSDLNVREYCDTDNDGLPDVIDLDSDDDGCYDVSEAGHADGDTDGILGNSPVNVDNRGLVTGQAGYTGTSADVVTAYVPVNITSDPTAQSANIGDTINFSASASGGRVLTYQWQSSTDNGTTWTDLSEGAMFTGTTTTTLTISSLTPNEHDTQYRLALVSDDNNCITSYTDHAQLTVRPDLIIGDATATEGSDLQFTVTATHEIGEDITFDLSYTDITTSNLDYTVINSGLIPAGNLSTIITVPAVDDNLIEPMETFTISMVNGNTAVNDISDTGTGTITDNDGSAGDGLAFENNNITVNEDAGTATINVVLTGNVPSGFTVDYTTNNGSAEEPGDYTLTTGQLTFSGTDGEIQSITIPIIDDNLIETLENLTVDLSNISTTLVPINENQGTINIVDNDNDGSQGIQVNDFTVDEDAGTATFDIVLIGGIQGGFTVDYAITDGSAISPDDYDVAAPSGTVSFLGTPNEVQSITVTIVDDAILESAEVLNIGLSNLSTGLIGILDGNGVGTILDNDNNMAIGLGFDTEDIVVNEDAGTVSLNVVLTGNVQDEFTVNYHTVGNTATDAMDYTGVPQNTQTLTFGGSNPNTQTITISIIDDIIIENDEVFNVILSDISIPLVPLSNADTASVTIIDNDGNEDWPEDMTIEACDTIPAPAPITGTGSCAITTVLQEVLTGDNDACPTEYFITRTWTITDCVGNERTHVQVITIEDTNAPDFVEPLPQNGTVSCEEVPEAAVLTAIDDCEGTVNVVFEETITNGANCTEGYEITRTWRATDCAGNETEHTQVITIPPTGMIMPNDYEEEITIMCGDALPPAPDLGFTGGCGDYTIVFNEEREDATDSDDYMIVRTWEVTDACGNSANFEQVVFVMQPSLEELELTVCVEDNVIDLLDYLPTGYDATGTFTATTEGTRLVNGLFDPSEHSPQEYRISYTSQQGNCTYLMDFIITVNTDCLPCNVADLTISKAVTANGDNINDLFEITGTEFCDFTFNVMIFNRWGNKVYEAEDYQNDWVGIPPTMHWGKQVSSPPGPIIIL